MDHRLTLIAGLSAVIGPSIVSAQNDPATLELGRETFATYCSSCHGPAGAGLIGPNLTDAEVLHGETFAEIETVIAEGVPAKSMPPWGAVLNEATIRATAVFVQSIMDDDLPSGISELFSTVTPFPFGSAEAPFLMRTFMPTMGVESDVFPHHGRGEATPKYDPKGGTFNIERMQDPVDGVPGAIAVNFGDTLSYCFDTTECRILYTWSGGFMDMTNYWGAGQGGRRKHFDYVPTLLGEVTWRTSGPPHATGIPQFGGYRKIDKVPEFFYRIGEIDYTLRITPGETPGVAECFYTETDLSGKTRSYTRMLYPNREEASR